MTDIRPCPICGEIKRRLLHAQKFSEGLLGQGYDVVVCKNCGAGFADGIPSQSALDRYYSVQSKYNNDTGGGNESLYDIRRFEMIVDQVAPHLRSADARILDVGCATGGLLSVFRRRGFPNGVGVDPSTACAAIARRLHAVQVRVATMEQLAGWREHFDLILMVGVLEHLRDVQAAIRTVASRLNTAGLFFVAVPDVEGLAASRNAPFQQFSMEHVNFFSTSSLNRVLDVSGFKLLHAHRKTIEWREDITEPVLTALCRQKNKTEGYVLLRDSTTAAALKSYLSVSVTGDKLIRKKIDELIESAEPVLIWGAGALARRLLSTTNLSKANIVGFVDSGANFRGKSLAGRTIFSPEQIRGRSEVILICSVAFGREIIRMIRFELALSNRLITLDEKQEKKERISRSQC